MAFSTRSPQFHKVRNSTGDEVHVSLLTGAATERTDEQEEHLENLQESLRGSGIHLEYEITWDSLHARSIKTDTG